jgi:hypothetical protein
MREVSVSVAQRRRIYDIQLERNEKDDSRGSSKRMREIAKLSNLKRESKEQEQDDHDEMRETMITLNEKWFEEFGKSLFQHEKEEN